MFQVEYGKVLSIIGVISFSYSEKFIIKSDLLLAVKSLTSFYVDIFELGVFTVDFLSNVFYAADHRGNMHFKHIKNSIDKTLIYYLRSIK